MSNVIVITGPSGVGKGTLLQRLRQELPDLYFPISATTRSPRPGEEDGVHYHFLTQAQFQQLLEQGQFVEHAQYNGDYYGTLFSELEGENNSLLEIELQGARQIRSHYPDSVSIFIEPPDRQELINRLKSRNTEDAASLQRRLATAEEEIQAIEEFDHVICNDELEDAYQRLLTLVHSLLVPTAA